MKTIATKIDNDDYDKLIELCNENGCGKSEILRKFVKEAIRSTQELERKPAEVTITEIDGKPVKLVNGKYQYV